MANIQAICNECGAHLTVDHEGARCPYCGTPVALGHSGGYELAIRATLVEDGEAFMEMGDWESARKSFSRMINDYSYDYRGWWGMARVFSRDFSFIHPTKSNFASICEYANRAYRVANAKEKELILGAMRDYEERLARDGSLAERVSLVDLSKAEKTETSPRRRVMEEKIDKVSKKIEKAESSPKRAAFWGAVVSLAVAAGILIYQIAGGYMNLREGILFAILLLVVVNVVAFAANLLTKLIMAKQLVKLRRERKRLVKEMESLK